MTAGRKTTDERLGDLRRKLATNHDGEIIGTVKAMRRVMETSGIDFHDLATRVEKPNDNSELNEAEMKKIYNAGVEAGLEKAEQERRTPNHFRDGGDAERWHEIASYCQQNPRRKHLYEREPGFIEGMVDQTAVGDVPSEAQQCGY